MIGQIPLETSRVPEVVVDPLLPELCDRRQANSSSEISPTLRPSAITVLALLRSSQGQREGASEGEEGKGRSLLGVRKNDSEGKAFWPSAKTAAPRILVDVDFNTTGRPVTLVFQLVVGVPGIGTRPSTKTH